MAFAEQRLPLGTVHAVLAAKGGLDSQQAFAVSNADDVYSQAAMTTLARQLDSGLGEHTLVAYALGSTIATDDPVTRGICQVDDRGYLVALTERRLVTRKQQGASFSSEDGLEPVSLSPASPTSVNLWGFQPAIWDVLETAMKASGLDEDAMLAAAAAGAEVGKAEVLLPDVVARMVTDGAGLQVRVVTTEAKMVGVTHAADLPVVSAALARQVAWGIRPSRPWTDLVGHGAAR